MKEVDICYNIQQNLKSHNINISTDELTDLYISTLSSMFELIDDGKTIEVDNLGSFWKKGEGKTAVSFFRPIDKLIDRINKK